MLNFLSKTIQVNIFFTFNSFEELQHHTMPGGQAAYDTLRFNESQNPPDVPDFTAKDLQYVRVTDQNGLDYNTGELRMNLNSLTTSFRFLDWKNSYWKIPLTVDVAIDGYDWLLPGELDGQFLAHIKGSFLSLVHSISVKCGNQQLVSRTDETNIPLQFKLLNSFSPDDQHIIGPIMGIAGPYASAFSGEGSSPGLSDAISTSLDRTSFRDPNVALQTQLVSVQDAPDRQGRFLLTAAVVKEQHESIAFAIPKTATTPGIRRLEIMATLPMGYVHDLFKNMPLVRGALWEISLNTHFPFTHVLQVNKNGIAAATLVDIVPSPVLRAHFQPIHVSQAALLAMTPNTSNTATNVTLSGRIGNSSMSQSILYCAMYDLEPGPGTKYLQDPVKTIVFQDFERIAVATANPNGLASGDTLSANITPGKSKLRGMLIVGDPTNTVNIAKGSSLISPFSPVGATNAPCMRLRNFNVSVSGKRLFDQNIEYSYDMYMMNMLGVGNPSGNGVDGLRSGLVGPYEWKNWHSNVWVDLTRHSETTDAMPTPIDVTWKNGNSYSMNYIVYLFYEKEFKIDILSGRVMV